VQFSKHINVTCDNILVLNSTTFYMYKRHQENSPQYKVYTNFTTGAVFLLYVPWYRTDSVTGKLVRS